MYANEAGVRGQAAAGRAGMHLEAGVGGEGDTLAAKTVLVLARHPLPLPSVPYLD